jgi:fucose permease
VLLTLLLAFAGFVALGLANSLLGVAWPTMRETFGMPIDALGLLLIGNTGGYMLASASSGRLIARLSIGGVLALSCGIAAASLAGIGAAPAWAVLAALSITAGMGGGAVDAGLNAYAAEHFSPRAMNWLHACFGIGATLGPAVMTAVLAGGLGWRAGFWVVGAVQLALAACFVSTRALWRDSSAPAAHTPAHAMGGAPLATTLRLPLAWLGMLLFFVYSGAEITIGQWVYSLLTEARAVPAAQAGAWISLYWGSLTAGRILFGAVVQRVSPVALLRWCMAGAAIGAALIWRTGADWVTVGGLALLGFALAPQFPLLISATPRYLGPRHATNGVGFQVAAASLGGALLPGLVGILAQQRGLGVLGPFLVVVVLLMAGLFELLARHIPREEP